MGFVPVCLSILWPVLSGLAYFLLYCGAEPVRMPPVVATVDPLMCSPTFHGAGG